MIVQAKLHVGRHLVEHARNLVQAGDVVLVVLGVGEGHLRGYGGKAEVDATKLLNRHLPVMELGAINGLFEVAHHELLVKRLVVRESRGVDGLEDFELLLRVLDLFGNCVRRVIAEAVVVASITDVGREFRIGTERVFPLGLKGVTQLGAAGVEARTVLRGESECEGAHDGCNNEQSHFEDLEVKRREYRRREQT